MSNINRVIHLGEKPFIGFQGEGKTQGKLSLFIRFAGCNLSCSICDTTYSFKSNYKTTINELVSIIEDMYNNDKCSNVVFTGGEPMLFQDDILEIIESCWYDISYEIETNGTIEIKNYDSWWNHHGRVLFNISPKGNVKQNKKVDTNLNIFSEEFRNLKFDFILKPLIVDHNSFRYIEDVRDYHDIEKELIYVQPVGITKQQILDMAKKYYEEIIEYGYNISMRLHVLMFDNKMGV